MAPSKNVFTDGVFDLIHANHVALLNEARTYGDRLIVGVFSDKATERYKRRPILAQNERLVMVQNLAIVDDAFIIEGDAVAATLQNIILEHNSDAVVYAGNATPEYYVPAEELGIMHRLPYHSGICTSEIIDRIVRRRSRGEF